MARPKNSKPSYCHHKASGRAFVVIDGKFVYLGDYGTPASRDAYDRVVGEWIARGRTSPQPATSPAGAGFTVTQLVDGFWTHAATHYVDPDGKPGREQE